MDDDITVSIRLEDDVALKLAMFAHEARITMNELVVSIIAESVYAWRVTPSRNRREGRYAGRWRAGSAPPYGKRRHRRVAPNGMFVTLKELKEWRRG